MRLRREVIQAKIRELHDQKLTYRQIAERIPKDRATVLYHLKQMGLTPHRADTEPEPVEQTRLTQEEIDEAVKMFHAGVTHVDMAYHFKRQPFTFSHLFKRLGLTRTVRNSNFDKDGNHLPCSQPLCSLPRESRGYCGKHYNKMLREENPKKKLLPTPRPVQHATFFCDHKSSRCECINPGLSNYHEYLQKQKK